MLFYFRFHLTIDQPYEMPYTAHAFKKVDVKVGSDSAYSEERGDACYGRLMGTFVENGK